MEANTAPETVAKFLQRVIEVEEKYAFVKKGQDTARRDELKSLLDEFCK